MKTSNLYFKSNAVLTLQYEDFKGVDFSTDPILVARSRAPFAKNLISDTGGMPEKRLGWRTLYTVDAPVYGIHRCVINDVEHILIHGGEKMYEIRNDLPTVIKTGIAQNKSVSFFMNGALYILTGEEYLKFDGNTLTDVAQSAYVPTIVTDRDPTGGGSALEDVNLIGGKWKEEFLGTAAATEYQLSFGELDNSPVSAKKLLSNGTWQDLAETTDFTVNRTTGKVTFGTAPGVSPVTGRSNVVIQASKTRDMSMIKKAKSCIVFDGKYVFLAGAECATDYRSGFEDPTYFPDTGYDKIGSEETDIMGYLNFGENIAIIKEDNAQDMTIFIRYKSEMDGKTVFLRKPAIVGVGAVSRGAIAHLRDEPMFLSKGGIFGIATNDLTSTKMAQNRSFFVDNKLKAEENLENAVSVDWNGFFITCVNSHAYVLDGKQNKTYKAQSGGDYVYECAYWENIPAVCFLEKSGELFFGTDEGKVCKFNSDISTMARYNDDNDAIEAVWQSRFDDDGYPARYKTMQKRGTIVTIKPYARSSAEIGVRTEKDPKEKTVKRDTVDIFDWKDIDFERFTFNSSDAAADITVGCKVKKYKRLQFVIRNNVKDEGFGVYKIVKSVTLGNFVKR